MSLLFYLSALITFVCAMGLLGSVVLTRTSRAASERLIAVATKGANTLSPSLSSNALEFALFRVASWLRDLLKLKHKPELVERFEAAGILSTTRRDIYSTLRILGPIAAAGLGCLSPYQPLLVVTVLAGAAYLAPDIVLQRTIKRRRRNIQLSIPDAVDLLVICVDAGLGLDQAMLRVSQELKTSHPELHLELQIINMEQKAGKPRLDAWQSMAKRTSLAEIDSFVNMLMQAERFGTPVAKALSDFADALRQKRRQRAEELAAKTTVKIMFPLVLFIFPTIFVVLLGPAVINIFHQMASSR